MLACQKRIGFVLNDNHFSMRTVYPPYSAAFLVGRGRGGQLLNFLTESWWFLLTVGNDPWSEFCSVTELLREALSYVSALRDHWLTVCIFTSLSSMRHIKRMLNKMAEMGLYIYRRKHKSSVRDIVSAVSVSHLVLRPDFWCYITLAYETAVYKRFRVQGVGWDRKFKVTRIAERRFLTGLQKGYFFFWGEGVGSISAVSRVRSLILPEGDECGLIFSNSGW